MTLDERARKIAPCWQPASGDLCQCPMCMLRPLIATQLREVEREAQNPRSKAGTQTMVGNLDLIEKLGFQKGFNAAKEKAAGIAAELCWKQSEDDNCLKIAERIREMEP